MNYWAITPGLNHLLARHEVRVFAYFGAPLGFWLAVIENQGIGY